MKENFNEEIKKEKRMREKDGKIWKKKKKGKKWIKTELLHNNILYKCSTLEPSSYVIHD